MTDQIGVNNKALYETGISDIEILALVTILSVNINGYSIRLNEILFSNKYPPPKEGAIQNNVPFKQLCPIKIRYIN